MPTFNCFCGKKFDAHENIIFHASAKGHNFKCGCGALFGKIKLLRRHQTAVHSDDSCYHLTLAAFISASGGKKPSLYHCSLCSNNSFKERVALDQHMNSKHSPLNYVCKSCGKDGFRNQEDLEQHLLAKHSSHKYQCGFCNKKPFNSQEALQQHEGSAHLPRELASFRYTASEQKDNLRSKQGVMNQEVLEQHSASKSPVSCHNCEFCPDKRFKSETKLLQHSISDHQRYLTCSELFSTLDHLHAHQQQSGHYYCQEHQTMFSSLAAEAAHWYEYHRPEPSVLECNYYERKFDNNRMLDERTVQKLHTWQDGVSVTLVDKAHYGMRWGDSGPESDATSESTPAKASVRNLHDTGDAPDDDGTDVDSDSDASEDGGVRLDPRY
ncbi:hypothetical protein LTR37_011984 [Vermiconidia calcicola]|uniref:Uncharacterized protein n=1 Tax=Vermiconidia calcicola TaxID=1690605 RepID=A0ACC3N0H8_9PEZI|nr:hypothetical protein LTR37_011984 [Vermiconidia calcicola]